MMTRLALGALLVGLSASAAVAEWKSWPISADNPLVAAGFKHDDGGTLLVICNRKTKLMSIAVEEPRAHWEPKTPIEVTTRADTGESNGPSHGFVIAPTRLVVEEQSTWDINTMSHAKAFFAMGAGGYARIYPVEGFREMVEPILMACGDHF